MDRLPVLVFALGVVLSGWTATPHSSVELGGALGARFDLTIRENVLKLDVEKDFFAPFVTRREKAGSFIGLGKLADALVHFARNSSNPSVRVLKEKVIAFIVAHQLADGYTGCLEPAERMRALWDTHEMGFILQALVADAELFGNRAALEAARRNADYVISNWNLQPSAGQREEVCDWLRHIGLGYGLLRLSAATSDRRALDFVRREGVCAAWDGPIVLGRGRGVRGHAYAHLATCLEQLQLNRLEPDDRLKAASRRVLGFMTEGDGLLIDGAGGVSECWTDDQDGAGDVGETCMTAYLLMFCRELLEQGVGDEARLGDLLERAVYNALFAAQSADGRQLRYYTPLNGVRKFWTGDLYCCPNNFRRAMSRMPELVFRQRGDTIGVDLYTACRAAFAVNGKSVAIREETDYPATGRVKIVVEQTPDEAFAIAVRVPGWCSRPSVRVCGAPIACEPGSQLRLSRTWARGDTVELDFPMAIRTVLGRKRQAGRIAILRGPVVHALDTRDIPELKDVHPLDAQAMLTLDPSSLTEDGDVVRAAVTVRGVARQVRLAPFADENRTLTYFRVPAIQTCGAVDDELLTSRRK